jgi:hypothetical protein
MRRRRLERIAEDVVGEAQQSAQSSGGRLEHMFARLEGVSDGPPWPGEDHPSSLVATFSTTAVVNSVVPASPPRSGVRRPPAMVSRADS